MLDLFGRFVHPGGGWRRAHGLTRVGDEIWAAETEGSALHRFHIDGRYIGAASLPEELQRPFRIAFDGYDGVLAIFAPESSDEQEALGVAELTLEGEFERWAVLSGEEGGKVYCPFDIAVMPDGRYVVADLPAGQPPDVRLQVFSADGRPIRPLLEDQVEFNAALAAFFSAALESGGPYERARAHHIHAQPDDARPLYEEVLAAEPGHLLARLHLATLLGPAEAEAQYRLAEGADPGDIAAHIADCRAAADDLDGAIAILKDAVEGDHPPEEYHRWVEQLGTWYLQRAGDPEVD